MCAELSDDLIVAFTPVQRLRPLNLKEGVFVEACAGSLQKARRRWKAVAASAWKKRTAACHEGERKEFSTHTLGNEGCRHFCMDETIGSVPKGPPGGCQLGRGRFLMKYTRLEASAIPCEPEAPL